MEPLVLPEAPEPLDSLVLLEQQERLVHPELPVLLELLEIPDHLEHPVLQDKWDRQGHRVLLEHLEQVVL